MAKKYVTSDNRYDVVYQTTSGRAIIAKNVIAKNEKAARSKLKKEMQASTTFRKIITVILIG
jgi:hypothetical protein